MAGVAYDTSKTKDYTADDHVDYQLHNPCKTTKWDSCASTVYDSCATSTWDDCAYFDFWENPDRVIEKICVGDYVCSGGYVCQGDYVCVAGYDDHSADAVIKGEVEATSNVYVNGKAIACVNDIVKETETYTVPSNAKNVDKDNGGNGTVSVGNSNRVYANGLSVAQIGSSVETHEGGTTSISSGSSNVFIG